MRNILTIPSLIVGRHNMGRGGWHGGGRPRTPENLQRKALHNFRLPQEWIDFLKIHRRKGSRMIEQALLALFGEEFETWKKDSEQSHEADSKPPA
jgi:hypothetical protein